MGGPNPKIEMEWRARLWGLRTPILTVLVPRRREAVFAISKDDLALAPATTRQAQAGKQFKEFARSVHAKNGTTLWECWLEARGGDDAERLTTLTIPASGRWDLPWELLLADTESDQLERLAIVRLLSGVTRVAVKKLPQKLKIHLLVGDDRGLKVDQERRKIDEAIKSLDYSARERLEAFTSEVADPDRLAEQIANAKADILWFSGHGGSETGVRFYFRGDRRLTATQIADAVQSSNYIPLYCVFNACELGCGEKDATNTLHPVLFENLDRVGVLSVVAMQAPIRDDKAIRMAGRIVSELAAGSSLEWAIARARSVVLGQSPHGDIDECAWATPTVWSAARPQRWLEWNTDELIPVSAQLLGRTSFESDEIDRGFAEEPPHPRSRDLAARLAAGKRLWLHGDPTASEHQRELVLILKALQQSQAKPAILVTLAGDASPQLHLQSWWDKLSEWPHVQRIPTAIVRALKMLSSAPEQGWRKLVEIPGMYVAVCQPPGPSAAWFWDCLEGQTQPTIVLSDREYPMKEESLWEIEAMDGARPPEAVATIVSRAPRLARALAVLNRPVHFDYLNAFATQVDACPRYEEWSGREAVVVESAGRPLITGSARRTILEALKQSDTEYRQAINDALQIVSPPRYADDFAMQVRRMELLVEAQEYEAAVLEADPLISRNEHKGRWATALRVGERLGKARRYLTNMQRLDLANCNVQMGHIEQAEDHLRRIRPGNSFEKARKLSLDAEIEKVGSRFDRAVTILAEAIEVCSREPDHDLLQLLRLRQDMTRLLHYFERRFESAAKEYEQIIAGLLNIPESEHELAVVRRNYGECLRSLCELGKDEFAHADLMLKSAGAAAAELGDGSLQAECYFQLASLARVRKNFAEESKWLDECEKIAAKFGDRIIGAIVRSRKFWRRVRKAGDWSDESRTEWQDIVAKLKVFERHGWSMRTLQNGYLYQALLDHNAGQRNLSLTALLVNRAFFDDHPAYDRNGDRQRIAWTYAGLAVLGDTTDGDPWQRFRGQYHWSGDFLRSSNGTEKGATEIWRELEARWNNG